MSLSLQPSRRPPGAHRFRPPRMSARTKSGCPQALCAHSSDFMTAGTPLQLQRGSALDYGSPNDRGHSSQSPLRVLSARVSLHMETHHLSRLLRYVYRACWYRDDDKFTIYRAALMYIFYPSDTVLAATRGNPTCCRTLLQTMATATEQSWS